MLSLILGTAKLYKIEMTVFLPISLELIIESELCASCHSFGGEEANTELAIHSPLQRVQWIRNAKQRFYMEIKGSKFQ